MAWRRPKGPERMAGLDRPSAPNVVQKRGRVCKLSHMSSEMHRRLLDSALPTSTADGLMLCSSRPVHREESQSVITLLVLTNSASQSS